MVSFLSPCVLPILPGYLAYITSMSARSAEGAATQAPRTDTGPEPAVAAGAQAPRTATGRTHVSRDVSRPGESPSLPATTAPSTGGGRRLLVPVGLFVLGFGTVFVAFGMTASLLGTFLVSNQSVISRVAGALIIVMGVAFMGLIPIPFLSMEKRFHPRGARTLAGNYVMGAAFGFGWTPCIGPTLGATLLIASRAATAGRGALLLAVYSLGLGIPFFIAALGVSRLTGTLAFFRRHHRAVMGWGGGMLVAFGALMLFDKVFVLSIAIQKWMESAGLGGLIGI